MKVRRQICLSNSRDVISPHKLMRIVDGGTESSTIEEAISKLQIVQDSEIPHMSANNTVSLELISDKVLYPKLLGPSYINKGQTYEYAITNFDNISLTYDITVSSGTATLNQETGVINLTTPEEDTSDYITMNINGYEYSLIYEIEAIPEGPTIIQDASGRGFYRHESGMGTVMRWVDKTGNTHNTLVLDAQYRTALQWGGYGTDIPTMTNYTNSYYYLSSGTTTDNATAANTNQANTASEFLFHTYTDVTINGISSYFEDATSSKVETDKIIAALGDVTTHAAGYCRNKTVDGVGCDLPNIQILIRIYCSMFTLDEMDASTSNNTYKFTMAKSGNSYNWYFGSYGNAWSSTEYDSNGAWSVNRTGGVSNGSGKSGALGVIPILEV